MNKQITITYCIWHKLIEECRKVHKQIKKIIDEKEINLH